MKIIIQCAGKKQSRARSFEANGKQIVFVANPELAPRSGTKLYAHPDDDSGNGQTWRERLLEYNRAGNNNPLDLLPAWRLYMNSTYRYLVEKYGADNIFILSAGWGLIDANFLTPNYDITFSPSGKPYVKRKERDYYRDFNQLPDDGKPVHFLVGKSYHDLLYQLTSGYSGRKILYYAGRPPKQCAGIECRSFGEPYTNWHYECARNLDDDDDTDR